MHASSLIVEQICEFGEGKISLTKDIVTEILAEAKSLHTALSTSRCNKIDDQSQIKNIA